MNIEVRRSCGHRETVTIKGNPATWKDQQALIERLPCTSCHTARLKASVSQKVPSLTELCFSGE